MAQQRALQRYEETWLAFTEELKTNPTVTLRACLLYTSDAADE